MRKSAIILLCALPLACHSAGYVEVREAWNSASEEHQFKVGGGYHFRNGAGVLVQTAYNTGKLDQFKHSFNEIEGWYPLWKISETLTFSPGAIFNVTRSGSTTAPWAQLTWVVNPDLTAAFKYRYNHMNYRTNNLHSVAKYNDSHQLIAVVNYKVSDQLSYEFEPNVFFNSENFNRKNGKQYSWELNHKFSWKMTQEWRPFIQLSWLDRDIARHAEQYRLRVGLRYYF